MRTLSVIGLFLFGMALPIFGETEFGVDMKGSAKERVEVIKAHFSKAPRPKLFAVKIQVAWRKGEIEIADAQRALAEFIIDANEAPGAFEGTANAKTRAMDGAIHCLSMPGLRGDKLPEVYRTIFEKSWSTQMRQEALVGYVKTAKYLDMAFLEAAMSRCRDLSMVLVALEEVSPAKVEVSSRDAEGIQRLFASLAVMSKVVFPDGIDKTKYVAVATGKAREEHAKTMQALNYFESAWARPRGAVSNGVTTTGAGGERLTGSLLAIVAKGVGKKESTPDYQAAIQALDALGRCGCADALGKLRELIVAYPQDHRLRLVTACSLVRLDAKPHEIVKRLNGVFSASERNQLYSVLLERMAASDAVQRTIAKDYIVGQLMVIENDHSLLAVLDERLSAMDENYAASAERKARLDGLVISCRNRLAWMQKTYPAFGLNIDGNGEATTSQAEEGTKGQVF